MLFQIFWIDDVSLAEFGLSAYQGQDFYDVSFVDAFNVPIAITPIRRDADLSQVIKTCCIC